MRETAETDSQPRTEASTHHQDDQTDSLQHDARKGPKPLRQTRYCTHTPGHAARYALPRQPRLASTRAGWLESARGPLPCTRSHSRKGGAEKGNSARREAEAPAGGRDAAGVVSAHQLFARFRCRREGKVGEYLGPERGRKAESACSAVPRDARQGSFSDQFHQMKCCCESKQNQNGRPNTHSGNDTPVAVRAGRCVRHRRRIL